MNKLSLRLISLWTHDLNRAAIAVAVSAAAVEGGLQLEQMEQQQWVNNGYDVVQMFLVRLM